MTKIEPEQCIDLNLIPFRPQDYKPFSYVNRTGPTHYTLIQQDNGWQEVKYFIERKLEPKD